MEDRLAIVLAAASHVTEHVSRHVPSAKADTAANFAATVFSATILVLGLFFYLAYMTFIVGTMLAVYLLPTILAVVLKKKDNLTTIILLNVLAGWTIAGWIAALVLVFVEPGRPPS